MADKKKKRVLRKPETVRQRADKAASEKPQKKRRIRNAAHKVSKPFRWASSIGSKEWYLPLPDNKAGRFMNKRRRLTPAFFVSAWKELRQVTWPTRKETWKLTFAVFIFAIFFGVLLAITDYGLDKLFRRLLLQ
jgi:preprotein translocase subunit SecE